MLPLLSALTLARLLITFSPESGHMVDWAILGYGDCSSYQKFGCDCVLQFLSRKSTDMHVLQSVPSENINCLKQQL